MPPLDRRRTGDQGGDRMCLRFTASASDPTQVCSDSRPRPVPTQTRGKGKDKEKEDTYFEMTGILSRKK